MTPGIVLSIAGSDLSGSAGTQANLKTLVVLGVYGMAALTGPTVQNIQGVRVAPSIDPGFVVVQVEVVLDDIEAYAAKLGIPTNARAVEVVADLTAARRVDFGFLVLNPVMAATLGDRLLTDEAAKVVRIQLLLLTNLIILNISETVVLAGSSPVSNSSELQTQAEHIVTMGARVILVNGGYLIDEELADFPVMPDGTTRSTSARVNIRNIHGTGCTLSFAITTTTAHVGVVPGGTVLKHMAVEARGSLHRTILAGVDWQLNRSLEAEHDPVSHLINLKGAQA